ncbi:MAG: UDP-galactopyranose mutase [Alistipes sp.]|nr:UDP-galactopyranose mutase [Alistipes sp.]
MEKQYDYIIVGAGLFGAVFARQAADAGRRCLVIDKRAAAGGNLRCERIDGIEVHAYGAHIFHTDKADVWRYVNRFVNFNRYTNSPLANYRGEVYNLPFNMNTFNRLWGISDPALARRKIDEERGKFAGIEEPANLEEQALKLCGETIYNYFIKGYTEKQWGRDARQLPAFIIRRIPLRFTFDNNYFNDPYQGIPCGGGYNGLINALLSGIEVKTGADFFGDRPRWEALARKVVFTGCIDRYFDYRFGRLEYRSLSFEHQRLETDNFQGNAVVNYTEREVPFTRIIEHKFFDAGTQPTTVITREYPADFTPGTEPYYPVNDGRNTALFERYRELARQTSGVLFGGRLAQYAYYDMDDTVEAALALARGELHA